MPFDSTESKLDTANSHTNENQTVDATHQAKHGASREAELRDAFNKADFSERAGTPAHRLELMSKAANDLTTERAEIAAAKQKEEDAGFWDSEQGKADTHAVSEKDTAIKPAPKAAESKSAEQQEQAKPIEQDSKPILKADIQQKDSKIEAKAEEKPASPKAKQQPAVRQTHDDDDDHHSELPSERSSKLDRKAGIHERIAAITAPHVHAQAHAEHQQRRAIEDAEPARQLDWTPKGEDEHLDHQLSKRKAWHAKHGREIDDPDNHSTGARPTLAEELQHHSERIWSTPAAAAPKDDSIKVEQRVPTATHVPTTLELHSKQQKDEVIVEQRAPLSGKLAEAKSTIGAKLSDAKELVSDKLEAAEDKLAHWKDEAVAKLETVKEKAVELKDDAISKAAEIKDDAVTKATEIKKDTTNKVAEIKKDTTTKAAELRDDASSKITEIKRDAISKKDEITRDAIAKKNEISRDIDGKKSEISRDISSKKTEISRDVDTKRAEISKGIDSKRAELNKDARDLSSSIRGKSAEIDRDIRIRSSELKADASSATATIRQQAHTISEDVKSEVKMDIAAVKEKMNELGRSISHKKDEIASDISERTDDAKERIHAAVPQRREIDLSNRRSGTVIEHDKPAGLLEKVSSWWSGPKAERETTLATGATGTLFPATHRLSRDPDAKDMQAKLDELRAVEGSSGRTAMRGHDATFTGKIKGELNKLKDELKPAKQIEERDWVQQADKASAFDIDNAPSSPRSWSAASSPRSPASPVQRSASPIAYRSATPVEAQPQGSFFAGFDPTIMDACVEPW